MPESDDEYRAAQVAEYSVYVASKEILIDGARAFGPGDPVPVSHVERGVVSEDDVVKQSTKAGKAALASNPTTTIKEG
ncbi:MAG TPA: hypothetical protein VFK52_10795 [Nocardioidaceae bacterium]|nr:hypothetical protein [Nocardioidaceae bacterium]